MLFSCINYAPAIGLALKEGTDALQVSYLYESMYGELPTLGRPRTHLWAI